WRGAGCWPGDRLGYPAVTGTRVTAASAHRWLLPIGVIHDHQTGRQGGVDVAGLRMGVVRHRLQDDDPGVHQGDARLGQAADRGDGRLRLETSARVEYDVAVVAVGGAGQGG